MVAQKLQPKGNELMETASPTWFIWHAFVGIAIGYAFRVFEHSVWRKGQDQETGLTTFGFALLILPPCIVVGAGLGYISVLLLASVIKDATAMSFAAYLLAAFWAFLSLDVRSFLRRH
jgi:hypothetical protein